MLLMKVKTFDLERSGEYVYENPCFEVKLILKIKDPVEKP